MEALLSAHCAAWQSNSTQVVISQTQSQPIEMRDGFETGRRDVGNRKFNEHGSRVTRK